jgi:hypothetical protein
MKEVLEVNRKHKLLTKELRALFKKVGSQMQCDDPLVVAVFFSPYAGIEWYATEFNPESGIFFGFVCGPHQEWGSWYYQEIQELSLGHGTIPMVERDKYFAPKRFSEIELKKGA